MEARGRGEPGSPDSRAEKGRRAEGRIKGTRGAQGGTGKGAAPGWRERKG